LIFAASPVVNRGAERLVGLKPDLQGRWKMEHGRGKIRGKKEERKRVILR